MKQIRCVGSYEIVIYNPDDRRVAEFVETTALQGTKLIAEELVIDYNERFLTEEEIELGITYSYTISKILYNSAYNVWAPTDKEQL